MREGGIDWVDGFGVRELGRPEPCGPDTVFMVASCSKPVTAMLVLQQVERGVLDLDTPINRFLRRWQLPDNELTAAHPVTLRTALSHTAGLTVGITCCGALTRAEMVSAAPAFPAIPAAHRPQSAWLNAAASLSFG